MLVRLEYLNTLQIRPDVLQGLAEPHELDLGLIQIGQFAWMILQTNSNAELAISCQVTDIQPVAQGHLDLKNFYFPQITIHYRCAQYGKRKLLRFDNEEASDIISIPETRLNYRPGHNAVDTKSHDGSCHRPNRQ